jgi:hypothetical protein
LGPPRLLLNGYHEVEWLEHDTDLHKESEHKFLAPVRNRNTVVEPMVQSLLYSIEILDGGKFRCLSTNF